LMSAFEEQRLCDVKGVSTEEPSDVFHMYPHSSLFDAATLLLNKKIHRLPIIDPYNGNVLYIMTQKPMIKFLYQYFPNLAKASSLNQSIEEARVGTLDDIKIATYDMKIIDALNIFVSEKISALPIVDENGKLINIYSKFDVINLAAEKSYSNLEVTLKRAIEHKTEFFDGVHTCKAEETIYTVMERLVKADVARLVVVDEEEKVVGIVTISDIIWYLIKQSNNLSKQRSSDKKSRHSGCRREDSIGEEFEELEELSDDVSDKSSYKINSYSCSPPPRWFDV